MKYLIDASSFMLLVKKADVETTIRQMQEAAILDLTFYEVGNAIWKESRLTKFLTPKEAERLGTIAEQIFASIDIATASSNFLKTLKIARKENLSFYDSSYISTAAEKGLTLITEDKRLRERANKYVKVTDTERLLSEGIASQARRRGALGNEAGIARHAKSFIREKRDRS